MLRFANIISVVILTNIFAFYSFGQSEKQIELLRTNQELVTKYFKEDRTKGLELSEQMLPVAYESKDTFYITYFLDQAGELNRIAGNYSRSLEQLNECLMYKKYWTDLKDLSLTHNNLAKVYMTLGKNDLAFHHLSIALSLMDKAGNQIGQGYYLNNIGVLFENQKNFSKAIEYYEKAITLKRSMNDKPGEIVTSFNAGICYQKLGAYNQALEMIVPYYEYKKSIKDSISVSRACRVLSSVFIEINDFEKAQLYVEEGLLYMGSHPDFIQEVTFEISKLLIYQHFGEEDNVNQSIHRMLNLIDSPLLYQQKYDVYKTLSHFYENKSDKDSAFHYLKLAYQFNDSILNKEQIYAVNEIEGKYEYEKNLRLRQEAELQVLRNEQELQKRNTYLILAISLAILAIISVIYFSYKNKLNKDLVLLKNTQNILLKNQQNRLKEVNTNLTQELTKTKMTLQEQKSLVQRAFKKSKEQELPDFLVSLSKREYEVLVNLALGHTDEELAEKLHVSKSTVKTHLRRIYSKLLVKNRAEAVAIAHKYNLIGEVELD